MLNRWKTILFGSRRWGGSIVILALFLGGFYYVLPRPDLLQAVSFSTTFYDTQGKLLRVTLSDDEKYRVRVGLGDISPQLVEATLLHEDRHFFEHPGVNPFSLIRAFYETYLKRDRRVGGSTITMQLARMRFGIQSHTISGKVAQIFRALQLERHYEKEEILEAYLNLAPYGGNIEGVGAASLIYYHRPAYELSLIESLALSIVPQNPSRRSPLKSAGNRKLVEARSRLFEEWVKLHPGKEDRRRWLNLPLHVFTPKQLPFKAPHFIENIRGSHSGKVETLLNMKLQERLESVLKGYVERRSPLGVHNASALMVDIRDMSVRALVGSANFFSAAIDGAVDGTRGKRSPGSTLKPFIYALALDQGVIHPKSLLKDAPSRFADYRPENFDGKFRGPLHAREALVMSRNIPALQLASRLRHPDLFSFLKAGGIQEMNTQDHYGLALVLGGGEVTMQELVRLYAMLANEGELRPLRFLKSDPVVNGKRMLSPEAAYLTLDMLKDNPIATRHSFIGRNVNRLPVYWKTGTSNGFKDAWAVGLFGHYALAVWLGNFDGTPNAEFVGGQLAAPLLFDIVDAVQETEPMEDAIQTRTNDLNIAQVELCSSTGDLADELCPRTEWGQFIPGKSPIRKSRIYRKVAIDKDTGYRACSGNLKNVEYEVYEFWPSDLLKLFKKAGLPRRMPPRFMDECEKKSRSAHHLKPRITSPRAGVEYAITLGRPDLNLPLTVTTDSEVHAVYWFANDTFIGKSQGGEVLEWSPQPGIFILRAVDDAGAADSRTISVSVVQ